MKKLKNFDELLEEQLKDEEFREAYKAAETEYISFKNVLKAREEAGLTQEQIAALMGTTQSAVARLESRLEKGIIPSHKSLSKYAEALGKHVVVSFV